MFNIFRLCQPFSTSFNLLQRFQLVSDFIQIFANRSRMHRGVHGSSRQPLTSKTYEQTHLFHTFVLPDLYYYLLLDWYWIAAVLPQVWNSTSKRFHVPFGDLLGSEIWGAQQHRDARATARSWGKTLKINLSNHAVEEPIGSKSNSKQQWQLV